MTTRIGLAYNQKPETAAPSPRDAEAEPSRGDEEPPSETLLPFPPSAATIDEFAEWDSASTVAAVERALSALGPVVRLEATPEFPERLRAATPDIVFNIAEGLHGVNREAHVPAICEFFGVPYSGSDPFTLSLCLDKARTKQWLSCHGVPSAPFAVVRTRTELAGAVAGLGGVKRERPLFVKPVHEGSSKGISERNLCRSERELAERVGHLLSHYAQPVIIERYLPGAEFTCAVLETESGAEVLPVVGMNFGALPEGAVPVYGFEAKWVWDTPDRPLSIFECPARVDEPLRTGIEEVALTAFRVLGCRDWARVDVRLDDDGCPNVIEVNPLPGILPDPADNSCFPKAARAAGMSYDALIQACLRSAARRQGIALPGETARDRPLASRSRAAALG